MLTKIKLKAFLKGKYSQLTAGTTSMGIKVGLNSVLVTDFLPSLIFLSAVSWLFFIAH